MKKILEALSSHLGQYDGSVAVSDGATSLSRSALAARVAANSAELADKPQTLGLIGDNSVGWVVAQLAGWVAGKTIVPLPTFFSRQQLQHIIADANVSSVITTAEHASRVEQLGLAPLLLSSSRNDSAMAIREGAGQIIYTSGSTGKPKGVRLGLAQINYSAAALADAIGADRRDRYLSLLPLPLLLETITAICVPLISGASTVFDPIATGAIAAGAPEVGLPIARHRPTATVLVPQLLAQWIAQLTASGAKAPDSLRFVAVGGAPVAASVSEKAWALGIPAYEGYGLSECSSVVALNRPGERIAGTVGRVLPGLDVTIDDGEICVSGATVMDGYTSGGSPSTPFRTGDLGHWDTAGNLVVDGRKDNLLVMSSGRNVSPEWIETMISADPRVLATAVTGHGESSLTAVVVPSARGASWFGMATDREILVWLGEICAAAPAYAMPRKCLVLSLDDAAAEGLLTSNGRIHRPTAARLAQAGAQRKPANANTSHGDNPMSFYQQLEAATATDRQEFLNIPVIGSALRNGAPRQLYLDYLAEAYHHVKHTFPELSLAASLTGDECYQDALFEYMDEERGHEKWILEDIAALGGNPVAVRNSLPSIPCRAMVGYTYYAIEHISPYAMLGSVHVLEGMSIALADKIADAVKTSLGIADGQKGFSYLRSHGALDVEHVAFFRKLADTITDADAQRVIIETSRTIYHLFGNVLRELGERHQVRAHAA
ncbi:MAG: AMP-binding protein [Proteobacteria bacterium]|nr:AMP-binding protein [Pseudomonadota bacterium]